MNLPLFIACTLIRVSILEINMKKKYNCYICLGEKHSICIICSEVVVKILSTLSSRREMEKERKGEGLINVLAMINGRGVAITNWLCF